MRSVLIFWSVVASISGAEGKWIFNFTQPLYVATMPENARGRVYAIPQNGKMGVHLPVAALGAKRTSSENGTLPQAHHQSLVRFRIVSGDKNNFFKAESEIVGNFAYLRIRTKNSLELDLNHDLTPIYSLRVKAVYRRHAASFGGFGRNLETRTEVQLKITDQNDLSPVFLPDHYRAKIDRTLPVFSSVIRVTASDADNGLNGEVYYQLMNRTEFFTVHPTSGVLSLIRPLIDFPNSTNNVTLTIAAVDRASRLFPDSRSNQGLANFASVSIEISQSASIAPKDNPWTISAANDKNDQGIYQWCGLRADGLCATVSIAKSNVVPDRLEIDAADGDSNAPSFFYVHRGKHRTDFEVRSVAKIPAGFYNLTVFPIGASIFLTVPSSRTRENACASSGDAGFDLWLNQTELLFQVPEWAPSGFLVGRVRLHEAAGVTRFELRKEDEEKERKLPFYITPGTGMLYLNISNETMKIDFNRRSSYRFFIHVRRTQCPSEKEEKRELIVAVKDCNNRSPKFVDNCDVLVLEPNRSASANPFGCTLRATDEDTGDSGKVSYDLVEDRSPIAKFFHIDHDRGELTLKNASGLVDALSEGPGRRYSLTVRASDHGWPLKRYSDKSVIVYINGSVPADRGKSESGKFEKGTKKDNIHAPSVAPEWNFEINENAAIGQRVGKINAADSDSGYAGMLLFTIDHEQGDPAVITERPFDVDLYNGTIFVFQPLDREKRSEYSFRVSIRDLGSPSRRAFTKVVVKILDDNDCSPVFEKAAYRLRLKENASPGTQVLQMKAHEDDLGENGRVRCALITRTPYFSLDFDSCILTLALQLDREKLDRHQLIVQAQDYGQPPMSTLVNVTVMVEDANDNLPVCRSDRLKAYVPEDYPSDSLVTCVDAYDPDVGENGRISYRLVGSSSPLSSLDEAPFYIDPATGCIRLGRHKDTVIDSNKGNSIPSYLELLLDYERQPFYNLTVELTDFGSPRSLKSSCHVFVEVLDVDENRFPPKFRNIGDHGDDDEYPMLAVEAEVYENENAPTFVKQLTAIDPDATLVMADPKPIYSIADGDGLGVFTIDQEGRIFASRSLDRETKSFYWLTVVAQDRAAAPLSSTVDVFVRILDQNDNCPVPSQPMYYASVMENSPPNVIVIRVEASDADFLNSPMPMLEGDEEDDDEEQEAEGPIKALDPRSFESPPLTFKITRGDPQSFFKMDPATGYISTHRRALDRETTPELELEVSISDNGIPEPLVSTVLVVVRVDDENDNEPTFPTKMMNYEIPERIRKRGRNKARNDTTNFLCRVFAYDEDEGKNGEIRYSIVEGNEARLVRIDSETGSIYAMDNASWNESQSIILKVRATDQGSPPKHTERHVHLTPISIGSGGKGVNAKSLTITSNLVANPLHVAAADPIGHRVGLLEASLSDSGDGRRIWFYFLSGNDDNAFALRPDTGVILLAKRPTLPSYNLTFLATADGIAGVIGHASILVQSFSENERPQFSVERIQARIAENQRPNALLVQLSKYLKSTSANEEIRYFMSENYYSRVAHSEGLFQVDAKSGAVYLKQALDRERQSHYAFKVGARSRRGRRGYVMVDVQVDDLNDRRPRFIANRHTHLRIPQSTNPGSVIHNLAAFDGDEGANGRLTYSLTMDSHKNTFSVDPQTGALRLLRSLLTADPKSIFMLSVKVEDGGRPPLFDTADVRISLTPNGQGTDGVQAGGVRFTQDLYSFRVNEKIAIGSFIGHVQTEGGSAVEYSISDDPGQYFTIHPLTGAVTLGRPFEFEHAPHVEATVRARSASAAAAAAEGTARIVVTLTDGNTHCPQFTKLYYEAEVEENTSVGAIVLIVNATDEDTGQAGVVTYHIADHWASRYFHIDYFTGAIRLMRQLDYENASQRRFEFRLSADDLGDPKMHAVVPALVEIRILDTNNRPPIFNRTIYDFVVHTPAAPGLVIGAVLADDADTVGSVKYALRRPANCWQLKIGSVNGIVRLSRQWADEKMKNTRSFACTVTASDGIRETEANVSVKIIPYVAPSSGFRFERTRYETELMENSELADGATIMRLRSVDIGPEEPISYRLLNNGDDGGEESEDPYVSLHSITGVLSITEYGGKIDRESTPVLTYIAEARRLRYPEASAARTVIVIRVLDMNDIQPRFVGLPYSITVPITTKPNATLFRVNAIDIDEGPNGIVTYELHGKGGNPNIFRIDKEIGEISLAADLQAFGITEPKEFEISVVATDSGSPPLSSTAPITVHVVESSIPVFPNHSYNASVMEGPTGVGSVLFEAHSFGITPPPNAVIGYTIRDDETNAGLSSHFDLDFITGRLTVQKALNRKWRPLIRLSIRARDYSLSRGRSWSDATVFVHVLNYNSHPPAFDKTYYVVNISENEPLNGGPIATFKATDEDEGDNGQFQLHLENHGDYFRIDGNTGAMALARKLDYETQRNHMLTVVAKDYGTPALSGTAKVQVNVLDANDFPPAFAQMAFNAELPSSQWTAGQFVGQALASDPDECDQGRLRYSIFSGDEGGRFAIDPRSGVLRTAGSTDPKSPPSSEYSLNLTVTDGVYSASCKFLIKIRSGSLAGTAQFQRSMYNARVKESAAPGTFVTEIRVEDKVDGFIPALKYRLIGSSLFRMEETTGKVFTSRRLGPLDKAIHSLTIIAEKWSDFTLVANCQLQVTIVSENNRPPKFLADRFFATLLPNTKSNTIILKLRAIDLDRDDVLEYSFDSRSSANFEEYFFLDSNTGALAVRRSLESVAGSFFKVDLRVTDRGNPPQRTTAPLEIRVVGKVAGAASNIVSFTQLEYIFAAPEDADVGTEIGRVSVARGSDDAQGYRFAAIAARSNSHADWISVDETTGAVQVAQGMDRETTSEVQFYVALRQASSKESLSMALIRILIEDTDDSKPTFENVEGGFVVAHVAEDAAVGTLVTVFAASDRDSGEAGRVTYWIDASEAGAVVPFKIDATTGWLTTVAALDRETQDTYTFTVAAGSPTSTEWMTSLNVTVKVEDSNDQKPIFSKREYDFRLDSSSLALPGFVIGRVAASDADLPPSNEIRYYIVSGNELGLFDIRSTGEIYLARQPGGNRLSPSYRLAVLATDGLFEDSAYVNVTIDNKSMASCQSDPSLSLKSQRFNASEDAPIGKVIGRLAGLPPGYFYKLGAAETIPKSDFAVKENGRVIVSHSLDYEKRDVYNYDIGVFYGENGVVCDTASGVIQLMITIFDINDCAAVFVQESDSNSILDEISVVENYNGTFPYFLGRVHAIDHDAGENGQVLYQLRVENQVESGDNGLFTIEPTAGAIFLWRPLDREQHEMYNLTVIASDKARPEALHSRKNILIRVIDTNDNVPVFIQESYDVSAPEDTPIGVVLVQVGAISADAGENAAITYSLEKAGNSEVLKINEKTGEVTLGQSLDYETSKEHRALVIATDGGSPPLSSSVQFVLRVLDRNDNDPKPERRHYTAQVLENTAIGSRVLRLSATDLDSGKNGLVGYRVESSNPFFQIHDDEKEPGWITLANRLDYGKATRHEFQVIVHDHGHPQRSAVVVVTVDTLDVNNQPPVVLNCNRTLVVKARVSTATPITTLHVTDADGPTNGKPFHFTLEEGVGKEQRFKLDPHGGLYAVQTPLELPEYHLMVSVRDSGEPPLTSQCRLHVRVTEESRFSPRLINTSFLVLSYMGEMNSGGVVGRVLAVDDDPKDSVQYSIADVRGGPVDHEAQPADQLQSTIRYSDTSSRRDTFSIDPDDGRISAAAELPPGEYILNVSASDGRFDTFALIGVNIRSVTTKMLDSAVSLRILGQEENEGDAEGRLRHGRKSIQPFDERRFVEQHLKSLTHSIASAVNARSSQFVHVLSVQKASYSGSKDQMGGTSTAQVRNRSAKTANRKRRWRREEKNRLWKRSAISAVDVLIAVQKSRHHDYFKPEYVRKTLEQKLEEVEQKAGLKVVSLVTEICRPDRCRNGGICRERLHLYDTVNNAILTETFSFVSPTHKRWAECVCADGYSEETCEAEVNQCANKPCPTGHVCVPSDVVTVEEKGYTAKEESPAARGYRCLCTGMGCAAYDSVHLMSPRSWIRYTLSENLETEMRFSVKFRTVARSGTLLYAGGASDFQSLELFGGQLRYRYDLGDGDTLLYVSGRPSVDDGLWHTVRLERKGRTATLTLDDSEPQTTNAPGGSFVLNLHGADVYLGAAESGGPGFVGCLKEATLNEDILPWHGPGVQLFDVDVGKCTDTDFKRLLTAAAGVRNTCGWCLNNGTCVSGSAQEDSWSCICPAPFTGLRCETLLSAMKPGFECLLSPCRNGGKCLLDKSAEGGFRCRCSAGYTGRTCSVFGGDPCGSNPCANGGLCTKIGSANDAGVGFYCNCTAAWAGPLCRHASMPSPNIVGGLLGITVPELIGIIAIFLVLILLTVVIVLLCRRQRSSKRKKYLQRRGPSAGGENHGENEPMFSESDVTPSTFAHRSLGGNMLVSGGPCGAMVVVSDPNSSVTPVSPAACSAPASFGNGAPPPLPPRARGFQPHRGSKLSNLESALSTGIPTVQVRPLSMSERQSSPVEGGLARAAGGGYLETAANYGSAAEELERLGRRASPTLDDLEDWKAALNRMNADSLEKLKVAAGITDDQWTNDGGSGRGPASDPSAGPPSSTGENPRAAIPAHMRRPEEERSSGTYQWDYSDWNSTLGQHVGPHGPVGPYATLSHLSVATDDDYGNGTLPRGVCRLEETDSECAANESDNEERDTNDTSELQSSRLRGDAFTKEIMALTRSFGRKKVDNGDSDGDSSRPILTTFKSHNSADPKQSYLDRYLPRPVDPPSSTASERKLLLSQCGEASGDEPTSAALDHLSDDEEFATPSAVLDDGKIGVGPGGISDSERSTDSVVLAGSGGVTREDSTLIVCSISDDDEDGNGNEEEAQKETVSDTEKSGNNNRTFLKRSKKQTQV